MLKHVSVESEQVEGLFKLCGLHELTIKSYQRKDDIEVEKTVVNTTRCTAF
jgi:hypothetical protein